VEKIIDGFLRITGAGTPGILLTVLLEIPLFFISFNLAWGKININSEVALVTGLLFLLSFLILTLWSLMALPFEKRGRVLVKNGPYRWIRHPSYFAKIFLLLPGLAIIFHTWLPIASLPLVMIIWTRAVEKEEKELAATFEEEYLKYQQTTGKFFPKVFKLKRTDEKS